MGLFSFILLLFGALSFPSSGHAQTVNGTVCLVSPGSAGCPISAAPLAQTLGNQLRVAVFLQGLNVVSGFDVTLLADHTILKPIGASLNGSILPSPQQVVVECLGGILVTGNVCSSNDNFDTLHFTVVACPGCISTVATGLLFTAMYNVTSATLGIPLAYQASCTGTSVSDGTCVTISGGSPTPIPENLQTAIFTTSTSPAFVMTASPTSISLIQNSSGTSTITITSVNDFSDTVNLATTVSPPGPIIALSPASVTLDPNQTQTSIATISTPSSPTGAYSITITGISTSFVRAVSIIVTVNPLPQPDFSLNASPTSLTVILGSSSSSTINLSSLNGFTGSVILTASVSSLGPSVFFSPANVTLPSGGTGTSTMTVLATSSTTPGFYSLLLIGRTGTDAFRTVGVFVTVPKPDFSMSQQGSDIGVIEGSSGSENILLTSFGGFNGALDLSASIPAPGLSVSLNPTSVVLSSGWNATSTVTVTATPSTPPGSYLVTVTGASGTISHKLIISITVFPQPDFTLTADRVSFIVHKGSIGAFVIIIAGQNGFFGTLTGSSTVSPVVKNGPSSPAPFSVLLSSGATATLPMTIDTSQNTRMGTYTITVSLISGSLSHRLVVTVIVTH